MEYAILGRVRVRRGNEPVALAGSRMRRLLAALLVDAPQVVPSTTLIERLWGDNPPATAMTALHVHVSKLRQALEPDRQPGEHWQIIRTTDGGYVLDADGHDLDAARYVELIADATRLAPRDPERAVRRIEEARELWAGRPWGELADEPWLQADGARLHELRCRGEELWADLELRRGRHELVLEQLAVSTEEEPLREHRWEQLMLALYRSGRQAEALRVFHDVRDMLVEELGIEPGPALRDLERAILLHDPTLELQVRPTHNLPAPLTTLVGRTEELGEIDKLLAGSRLVTIIGPGGCGKTRLAVAAAGNQLDQQPDGCWFVDLTSAPNADLVAVRLASDLGLREGDEHAERRPHDVVRAFLRRRQLLVVLDNCEHVAGEVAGIAASLLATCPRLQILATSRVALGITGETCYALPPLSTPEARASLDEVAESPAVRLFFDRADDVNTRTGWHPGEVEAAGELCRRLDGLPLAIELAARSTRTLAPSDLLTRLEDRLSLEGDAQLPERHRALRATIDWSYALLNEPEQRAFRRLSVFTAGATTAGAEAVLTGEATSPEAAIGLVSRLIAASLLRPDHRTSPPRYQMLDTIRDYAQEHLDESGERARVAERQLEYLIRIGMVVRVEERVGPPSNRAMDLLDAEHDNIRETLDRLAETGDGDTAIRLAGAMGTYWHLRGHWGEGRSWIMRALACSSQEPSLDRARALVALAEATSAFSGIGALHDELEEAVAISRRHDHLRLLGVALIYVSLAYGWRKNLEAMRAALHEAGEIAAHFADPWLEESVRLYTSLGFVPEGDFEAAHRGIVESATRLLQLGDESVASAALMYAGNVSRITGDLRAAREELEQSLELTRAAQRFGTHAHSAMTLAQISMELGDADTPSLFRECMAALEQIGDERCYAICQRSLGSLALDRGDLDEAMHWLTESIEGLAGNDDRSLAIAVADIASVRAAQGRMNAAAGLAGAAQALARRSGLPLSAAERARVDRAVAYASSNGEFDGVLKGVSSNGALDLETILALTRA